MPAFPFSLSRRGRRASRFLGLALALASVAAFAADPAEGDPLAPAMAGEYALQAGKLDEAARWYLDAARAARGDAVLAERATRIALLAKDDARAAAALKLWRASAERSPAMRNAEATLALRRKDERAAFRELQILMRGERGQAPDKDGWRYALLALDAGSGDPKLTGRLLGRLIDSIPDELNAWLAFGEFSQQLQRNDLSEQIVARVVAAAKNAGLENIRFL